ncbi:hypothetical protein Lepto7375DRAFT_0878 [Leptolyngbya sp. PCC 7375]|nr:hypothetical protein Lepto7375DRAFT_0878 [Leptolyngbya sp. PCC 7375]
MNQSDIEHRDQVLRAYFAGRDWDVVGEYGLKRKLVLNSSQLLPNYPFLIDDEWECEPGQTNEGRGDFVFTDGKGRFAVVEVKYLVLNENGSAAGRKGSTRRNGNTKKRRKVEGQASDYAEKLRAKLGNAQSVEAYYFTSDDEKELKRIETGTAP